MKCLVYENMLLIEYGSRLQYKQGAIKTSSIISGILLSFIAHFIFHYFKDESLIKVTMTHSVIKKQFI